MSKFILRGFTAFFSVSLLEIASKDGMLDSILKGKSISPKALFQTETGTSFCR